MLANPELIASGLESLTDGDGRGQGEELARLERDLQRVQLEEDRAIRLFVTGRITEEQLDHQRRFITERLERARAEVDACRERETAAADQRRVMEEVVEWAQRSGEGLDGLGVIEFETWLELGQGEEREDLLSEIKGYNRDDCLSTLHLRDWLEEQRAELEREFGDLPRPTVSEPEEREDSVEQKAVNELADKLCVGLPESFEDLEGDERGRWLLAQLLNWHRREAKSFWWRYFYLVGELTDEERREESDALGELTFEDSWPDPRPRARSTVYRFRFPPQDHAI